MAINPMEMPQGGGITQAMPQAGSGMPQGMPQEPTGQNNPMIGGDLLKALAAQKLLKEKQMAENQLAMAQEADANTVVAKNEGELEQRSLDEVSKGVSGVLNKKNSDMQRNMKKVAAKGIAGNARPNMAMMAQGGIVGFAEGQKVDAATGNKIVEFVKENPWATALDTAALIALVTPIPGGRPAAGLLKGAATGLRYGPKIAKGIGNIAKRAFTTPNKALTQGPKGAGSFVMNPAGGSTASRVYSPGKTALGLGALGTGAMLMGGDKEPALEEEVTNTDTVAPVVPPVAPPAAPVAKGESYEDKRTRFARAGAMGGISGFAKNITALENKEREQDLETKKVDLEAKYKKSVVDANSYNNAQKNLLNYSKQLTTLLSQHPMVVVATRDYDTAIREGDERAIKAAKEKYDAARKQAIADIGATKDGGSLLAQIAALKEVTQNFRGSNKTTASGNVAAALEAIK